MFGYIVKLIKFFFKKPEDMLTEEENTEMEFALTEIPRRQIMKPGKKAMQLLPINEPNPPLVRKVNIVVKVLDPTTFPTLTKYPNQMLLDLQKDNILNDVIDRDIIG